MLSLDAGGRSSVLPQLGVPCFVDSRGRSYPAEEWVGAQKGDGRRELEERREGQLWLVCKINFKNLIKKRKPFWVSAK